ncbi:MAG TPA: VWA domain-containing protein [Terriglobia bacterium]|nr:VWA domain-containing protein [Terriglobia bacterium]
MLRIIVLIILMVVSMVIGAQGVQQKDKDFTFSVDVQLVQLPVSVLDKDGHPVSGLQKDHFQVFEDGVLQEISLFKHEDVPLSVGLVIDNSGSMHNKRERVNRAALTFARESNPEDETFIVDFDDAVYLEQEFTGNIADLVAALSHLDTRGETAIYDAVYLSAEHLNEGTKDKKALLLITDGEDNKSNYSLEKVLAKLRESKTTVYTIGLLEESDRGSFFRKSPARKAREVLERFAETTGGRAYFPKSVDEVEGLCRRIAHDIRNHYTLGYTPSNGKPDGSWRRITVRVNPPRTVSNVTVRAKEGYYAPKADATSQ